MPLDLAPWNYCQLIKHQGVTSTTITTGGEDDTQCHLLEESTGVGIVALPHSTVPLVNIAMKCPILHSHHLCQQTPTRNHRPNKTSLQQKYRALSVHPPLSLPVETGDVIVRELDQVRLLHSRVLPQQHR